MSSTGVRESSSTEKRAIKGLIQNEAQFIQSLRVFSNSSTLSGLGVTGGEINNSPKDPSGNYLSRLGDKMLGPLALAPPLDFTIEIDANNTIDIGPLNDNAQYTSNVQLDSIQPNGFVLDIIANAAFDGQILVLRTFAPSSPFTISQGTLGNGGNIQTGDSNDLTVGDLQTVTLIFDEALKIEANTGGSWRVLSVSSGGGGGGTSNPTRFTFATVTPQTLPTKTTIDAGISNVHHVIIDKDIEFEITNPPPATKEEGLRIVIDIDGTGGYTSPLWPASLANPPIIPTTPNTRFTVVLYTINQGVIWTHVTSVGSSSRGATKLSQLEIDQDYDANTFDVKNVDRLIFDQTVGDLLAATDTGITSDIVKNMDHNVPTGAQFIFTVNNDFSPAALIIGATGIISQTIVPAEVTDDLGLGILPWNNIFANSGTIDNIIVDGAGTGVTNIGHLDFVDNLATPAASLSIYTDGTDIFANTGAGVVNLSDIASGGGANTALSNLDLITAINRDLLPNITGTFNLGSDSLRWGNVYFGRIVFPTDTNPISNAVNIVRNGGGDMQYNVPAGKTFNWTFNTGSVQLELSDTLLTLKGVGLDMDDDNIINVTNIGDSINEVSSIYANKVRFPTNNSIVVNNYMVGRNTLNSVDSLILNAPTNQNIAFTENGNRIAWFNTINNTFELFGDAVTQFKITPQTGNFLSIIKSGASPALYTADEGHKFTTDGLDDILTLTENEVSISQPTNFNGFNLFNTNDIFSALNDTYDIGSTANRYQSLYVNKIIYDGDTQIVFDEGVISIIANDNASGGVALTSNKNVLLQGDALGLLGFFANFGNIKQIVTGSRGGSAALASLLTALDAYGLIEDNTT